MKNKFILLSLISVAAFASVNGSFETGFDLLPKIQTTSKTVKYSFPYELKLDAKDIDLQFGIKGTYNKEEEVGKLDFLKNEADIYLSKNFNLDNQIIGLKINNNLKTSKATEKDKFVNVSLTTTYNIDYTNNFTPSNSFKSHLDYSAGLLGIEPKSVNFKVSLENKIDNVNIDMYAKLYHNLKYKSPVKPVDISRNFFLIKETDEIDSTKTNVKFIEFETAQEQKINFEKSSLKFVEGINSKFVYGENLRKTLNNQRTEDEPYKHLSYNKVMLNAEYNHNFDVLSLNAKLNNDIVFGTYSDNKDNKTSIAFMKFVREKDKEKNNNDQAEARKHTSKLYYALNPSVKLSKTFNPTNNVKVDLSGEVSAKLELLAAGPEKNVYLKNDLVLNPELKVDALVAEGLHILFKANPKFTFKGEGVYTDKDVTKTDYYKLSDKEEKYQFGFSSFEPKVSLGLKYNW